MAMAKKSQMLFKNWGDSVSQIYKKCINIWELLSFIVSVLFALISVKK